MQRRQHARRRANSAPDDHDQGQQVAPGTVGADRMDPGTLLSSQILEAYRRQLQRRRSR